MLRLHPADLFLKQVATKAGRQGRSSRDADCTRRNWKHGRLRHLREAPPSRLRVGHLDTARSIVLFFRLSVAVASPRSLFALFLSQQVFYSSISRRMAH